MKIGILSLPLGINYGGILQTWALQTVLQKMGHEVIILNRGYNYPSLSLLIKRLLSSGKCIYRRFVRHDKAVRINNIWSSRYYTYYYDDSNLKAFIEHYILLTRELRTSKALSHYVDKHQLGAIIVGSDQVWREAYVPDLLDYFLGFCKRTYAGKRIAYAASFGTDRCDYNREVLRKCRTLIEKFDALSVRENSGCEILREKFSVNAPVVLDPTLLLTAKDYEPLFLQENIGSIGRKTLVQYILDGIGDEAKIIADIASFYSYECIELSTSPRKENGALGKLDGVGQWLEAFANATFVVTDSFHGCVFSIIFNKPFVAIANRDRGLSRFATLLEHFSLQNRLVYSFSEYILRREELRERIDYTNVNKRLESLRGMSLRFLCNVLN